jgi:broad specificity phosphatase PhoE
VNTQIHLVRHGEVHNPNGLLYGRLPGFHLSERGAEMAKLAAQELLTAGRPIAQVMSSPLERALESAEPISMELNAPVSVDDQLIEASSHLEGGQFSVSLSILAKPRAWRHLVNPLRPSWGEPFVDVNRRMLDALRGAQNGGGDIVMVSHQLPIWLVHRYATGRPLAHDPRKRRCSLSSITSFEWREDKLVEVAYREPAAALDKRAKDVGAV